MTEKRHQCASNLGFILAAAGSAVGLGNIWKFPGKVGAYGGGAFLLCYLLIVFLVGFPVMLAELSIGRATQKNVVGAFRTLNPRWRFAGYIGIVTLFVILSYYCVVGGWVLKYVQIYAAGALADPHGTHRTCMEAVLAALEVVRDDEWMKDCHLWLYRGAWMEWELGMVDMAVPLSPDELIMKRHAIYRHLSQKDIMPFPGDDPREFWQRAEERTQNTAKLYDQLGMAEYQAIEVFVKMF